MDFVTITGATCVRASLSCLIFESGLLSLKGAAPMMPSSFSKSGVSAGARNGNLGEVAFG